jgi:hypothetical protein
VVPCQYLGVVKMLFYSDALLCVHCILVKWNAKFFFKSFPPYSLQKNNKCIILVQCTSGQIHRSRILPMNICNSVWYSKCDCSIKKSNKKHKFWTHSKCNWHWIWSALVAIHKLGKASLDNVCLPLPRGSHM